MTISQCKASRRRWRNSGRYGKKDPAKSARRDAEKLDREKARQARGKGK